MSKNAFKTIFSVNEYSPERFNVVIFVPADMILTFWSIFLSIVLLVVIEKSALRSISLLN